MTTDHSNYKAINSKLMQYCSELLSKALNEGIEFPDIYYKTPSKSLPMYLYPDNPYILVDIVNVDIKILKDMGWYDVELANKPFIIWYAHKSIQLCEIDVHGMNYIKPKRGINKDIPYLYSLCALNKDKSPYVAVVENPIHASFLQGFGVSSIACDSRAPTKSQIGYLARLGVKLIYIAKTESKYEQASEIFIKKLAKFTDIGICLIDDWEAGLLSENLVDTILDNSTEGVDFLAKRVLQKHNGKDDYARSIEVIETAHCLGQRNHAHFLRLAKGYGSNNYAHFAESLHLMGDLIQANVPVESARQITMDRFGVTIFLRDIHQTKLS